MHFLPPRFMKNTLLSRASIVWNGAVWLAPLLAGLQAAHAQEVLTLQFKDFYRVPSGPKGLEISASLVQASGQTARLTGYMVHQEKPTPGRFMLTPRPVQMSEHADGEADDLPASWVMVYLDPSQKDFAVPYTRGLLEITGTLSVGRREESDSRVSWIRLQLAPEATRGMSAFELAGYFHSLQHNH